MAESPRQVATVLVTVAMLTILTLSPSILIMTTCFTRIVIVFGFLRRALATQQLPPNPVIMGLALFLTLFIMFPTWEQSWEVGLGPYIRGELDPDTGEPLSQDVAFTRTMVPIREFMFRCLNENQGRPEIELFMGISGRELTADTDLTKEMVPSHVLVPAFVTSELKRAFWMGFLLYLPFLVVDMVISSVLMSMGMMMLPPVMISLPFKIILFVMVDGWNLLMRGMVLSFPAVGG
ncbi:MAG: flagellar type III secretion system pore protein FliP [Planctomycetes bacterium]|nr:flagellar type III secretion system pore protein FliP [Planctomycetota bacterium]